MPPKIAKSGSLTFLTGLFSSKADKGEVDPKQIAENLRRDNTGISKRISVSAKLVAKDQPEQVVEKKNSNDENVVDNNNNNNNNNGGGGGISSSSSSIVPKNDGDDETASVNTAVTNNNNNNNSGRQEAPSLVDGLLERYWRLSDCLSEDGVKIPWIIRLSIGLDIIKELKQIHDRECAHGQVLLEQAIITDKVCGRLEDSGKIVRTSSTSPSVSRDILGFGLILLQLALQRNLFLLNDGKRSNLDVNDKCNRLAQLLTKELQVAKGKKDDDVIDDLSGDFDFTDGLSADTRALLETVSSKAIDSGIPKASFDSLIELVVQCCGAMRDNRPNAETILDWYGSIVEDGIKATKYLSGSPADLRMKEEILVSLASKDFEILGQVSLSRESKFITGNPTLNEDGYETDDSYMPPKKNNDDDDATINEEDDEDSPPPSKTVTPIPAKERRASRLTMFLDEVKSEPVTPLKSNSTDSQDTLGELKSASNNNKAKAGEWTSGKAVNKRTSIKPTNNAISRFSMMWGGGASSKAKQEESLKKNVIKPQDLAARFDQQQRLSPEEVVDILVAADATLRKDANMPVVIAPATIVGDIHGQYFDLQNLIKLAGSPATTKYVFLGDYVDRGDWSCEVFLFIACLKVHYPQNITMLRGNHECDAVSSYFGFKEECEMKYGRPVFNRSIACFQCMPVACLIETGGAGRFLCCHGGISPHVTSLEQIEKCDRFTEPGMNGFLCDLLWSDPINDTFDDGNQGSMVDFLNLDYVSNPARGCSYRYGYRAIISFLANNQLNAIIRAHEVQQDGYRYHFQDITGKAGAAKARIMPPVITVFSAPNYCGRYGNKGAFLRVNHVPDNRQTGQGGFKPIDLLDPVQFDAVPHPDPIVLESETVKQTMRIEKQLPFMPTTFRTFVDRARKLAHQDEVNDNDPAVMERIPGMERHRRESEEEAVLLARKEAGKEKTQMLGTDLGGLLAALGQSTKLPSSSITNEEARKETEVLTGQGKVKSLLAKYQSAAAVDGINEMHPILVQKKMDVAKEKLEKDKRGSLTRLAQGEGVKINPSRKTIVESKSKDKKGGTAAAAAAASAAKKAAGGAASQAAAAIAAAAPVEEEVNFSPDELVQLKMLFLMIDRADDGSIDADDLVAWSAMEGNAVSKDEAVLCITTLDEDKDGKIGFVDYLSFAASLKLEWLKSNEANKSITSLLKKPLAR